MILQNLKIFHQNVCKNCLLTDIILENNKNFDIIFIQKHLGLSFVPFLLHHPRKVKESVALLIIYHGSCLQDIMVTIGKSQESLPILSYL